MKRYPIVGVLALQGDFQKHMGMLYKLKIDAIPVRKPGDLTDCDALILPGGESTSILRQLKFIGLDRAIKDFSNQKPLFGTCAGLILIARTVQGNEIRPLEILDIEIERNAFGRQNDSFKERIKLHLDQETACEAIFIRAPRIKACGPKVQVLASYQNEPVLIQQGSHLGATFHPELTGDEAIYCYFLTHLTHQK